MTIEANLTRIADALERIAANAGGTAAPAPAPVATEEKKPVGRPRKEPAPAPAPAPAPEPAGDDDFLGGDAPAATETFTREQVRAALVVFQKKHSPEAARKVLKDVGGADTLVKLPEDKFAAVMKAAAV